MHLSDRFQRNSRVLLTAAGALACAIWWGCSTTPPAPAKKAAEAPVAEALLRNGDQLTIRLDFGGNQGPQLSEVVPDENGEISLPLIGRIKAEGLSTSELAERIQANYVPRFYVRCNATVMATVRFFYVGGEVRAPGRFSWSEDMTLLKAINTASGFTEYANRGKVDVSRGGDKKIYNCDELRQHPSKDIAIHPGDSVYVPRSIF